MTLKQKLISFIKKKLNKRGLLLLPSSFRCNDLDTYFTKKYHDNYSSYSIENKKYINIGAGRFRHKYWTNVDLKSEYSLDWSQSDIDYNLFSMEALPIEDNSVEIIYTSHTIEHITNTHVAKLLSESYRTLKPGGCIRIVCPDVELAIRALHNKDVEFFEQVYGENIEKIESAFVRYFATHVVCPEFEKYLDNEQIAEHLSNMNIYDALNYFTNCCTEEYQQRNFNNHMNWFNENKLSDMLKRAGFSKIYKSRYSQSGISVLRDYRYFDATLPFMSLYIEAIK